MNEETKTEENNENKSETGMTDNPDSIENKDTTITEDKNNINNSNKNEVKKTITSTAEPDLSKVKIRNVLAYKIKNSKLNRVVAIVLLGIICFGAGIVTDRTFVRHDLRRGYYGKSKIEGNVPRGFYGNRKNNRNFNQNPNNNQNNIPQAPSAGQPQN
jgi:hypothetical protein